jgi:hypothetical protein
VRTLCGLVARESDVSASAELGALGADLIVGETVAAIRKAVARH